MQNFSSCLAWISTSSSLQIILSKIQQGEALETWERERKIGQKFVAGECPFSSCSPSFIAIIHLLRNPLRDPPIRNPPARDLLARNLPARNLLARNPPARNLIRDLLIRDQDAILRSFNTRFPIKTQFSTSCQKYDLISSQIKFHKLLQQLNPNLAQKQLYCIKSSIKAQKF